MKREIKRADASTKKDSLGFTPTWLRSPTRVGNIISFAFGLLWDAVLRRLDGNGAKVNATYGNEHSKYVDKESNLEYFEESKRVTRSGGIIIVDNVVRRGKVADLTLDDSSILGVRRLVDAIQNDPEVDSTVIGTVGDKGYDGFLYAVRK